MKRSLIALGIGGTLALAASLGLAQDGAVGADPIQVLQEGIVRLTHRIKLVVDQTSAQALELDDMSGKLERAGKQVEPGLYEVHSRVLWDAGWMVDMIGSGVNWVEYFEYPTALYYGRGRTTFLGPLTSYGIPTPAPGAVRKVRLFVNYGHQWMCEGTPTITVGDVEFELPKISGYYGDMGANWTNFREWGEYSHLGHAAITMHLKDFAWGGPHCGPSPGLNRPKGVVYRIEAFFYDEFPE